MDANEENEVDDLFMDWEDCEQEQDGMVQPQVDVNTVSGILDYRTMKVRGMIGKNIIYICSWMLVPRIILWIHN